MKSYKQYLQEIKTLLKTHNAKLIAHYYVDESIQKIKKIQTGELQEH